MSIIEFVSKKCAVCGHNHKFQEICSMTVNGYVHLDVRAVTGWEGPEVEMCPECGYANSSIDRLMFRNVAEIVKSDEYKKLAESFGVWLYSERDNRTRSVNYGYYFGNLSKVAPSVLEGFLYEKKGDSENAAISYRRAAWLCDDSGMDEEAKRCRSLSLNLLLNPTKPSKIEDEPVVSEDDLSGEDLAREYIRSATYRNYLYAHYKARNEDELAIALCKEYSDSELRDRLRDEKRYHSEYKPSEKDLEEQADGRNLAILDMLRRTGRFDECVNYGKKIKFYSEDYHYDLIRNYISIICVK